MCIYNKLNMITFIQEQIELCNLGGWTVYFLQGIALQEINSPDSFKA